MLLDWSLSTRASNSFFNFIKFKKNRNFCCTLFNLSSSLKVFFLQTGSRYFNKSLQTFLFSFEIKTLQPFIFHSNFGLFFFQILALIFDVILQLIFWLLVVLEGKKKHFFVLYVSLSLMRIFVVLRNDENSRVNVLCIFQVTFLSFLCLLKLAFHKVIHLTGKIKNISLWISS